MAKTGILVSFAIAATIVSSEAAKLIRLRSGFDCTTPGYFRDEFDCQTFYYCPDHGNIEHPKNFVELEVMNEIKRAGFKCPDGSIFDETLLYCERVDMIKSIPPECLAPIKKTKSSSYFDDNVIPDLSSNQQ